MSLTKDLAEVMHIRNGYLVGDAACWIEKLKASDSFVERYNAEIVQNAESARWLAALEQAMDEWPETAYFSRRQINKRADDIMREQAK